MTRVLKAGAVRLCEPVAATDDRAAERAAEREAELQQAYAAGLEDGRRQGEQAGGGELARLAATIPDAVRDAATALAGQRAADAAAIVDLGLEVARWILDRELADDTTAAAERITGALAELPVPPVRVRVNPALVDLVPVEGVEGDPTLLPGEALVDLAAGVADLTFDEAFRRAAAALGAIDG